MVSTGLAGKLSLQLEINDQRPWRLKEGLGPCQKFPLTMTT